MVTLRSYAIADTREYQSNDLLFLGYAITYCARTPYTSKCFGFLLNLLTNIAAFVYDAYAAETLAVSYPSRLLSSSLSSLLPWEDREPRRNGLKLLQRLDMVPIIAINPSIARSWCTCVRALVFEYSRGYIENHVHILPDFEGRMLLHSDLQRSSNRFVKCMSQS